MEVPFNFNATQEIKKGKTNYCETVFISKLNLKKGVPGRLGIQCMFFLSPEDGSWSPNRALLEHSLDLIYIIANVFNSAHFDSISFCDKFEINF